MFQFEIHITTEDIVKEKIAHFESFCKSIGAKPIIIELSKGRFYKQPMISKIVTCKNRLHLDEKLNWLIVEFKKKSFEIIRVKIETPVWQKEKVAHFYQTPNLTYFEWHGKVVLSDEKLIEDICHPFEARLSRNTLKNDLSHKFITIRDYVSEESIKRRINGLKQNLTAQKIELIKEELEFCIYDSNEFLDKGWIN